MEYRLLPNRYPMGNGQYIGLTANGNLGVFDSAGVELLEVFPTAGGGSAGNTNALIAQTSCWLPELSKYLSPGGTMLNTKGTGLPVLYGMDNRTGLSAVDGSAITLFTTAGGGIFRITLHLEVSAYTSGTITYTASWNDLEGTARTLAVSATAIGIQQANGIIRLKVAANTSITVQVTGPLSATFDVFAGLEEVQ